MSDQPQLPDSQLSLNSAECAIAYREGRHEELANTFLHLLAKFRVNVYFTLDEQTTHFVNVFSKNLFFYFTQEDYNPTDPQLRQFVRENPVISNVASMPAFRTTDPYVRILLAQQRNFAKILALFNPCCETRIDRKVIFDASPELATEWYDAFFENYRIGSVTENCWQQMRDICMPIYDDSVASRDKCTTLSLARPMSIINRTGRLKRRSTNKFEYGLRVSDNRVAADAAQSVRDYAELV